MTRKILLVTALLGAGAAPALAHQHDRGHPPVRLCNGMVVVETVRPKVTLSNGFTYEVLLQNRNPQRQGYSVDVTFENFQTLARDAGVTITIPNTTITITVPAGLGARSAETNFGTVSRNLQAVYFQAGVGARYDNGSLMNGSPAAVRLTNCRPVGG